MKGRRSPCCRPDGTHEVAVPPTWEYAGGRRCPVDGKHAAVHLMTRGRMRCRPLQPYVSDDSREGVQ